MKYRLILASNSPRRKEILSKITTDFEIIPSNKEEIFDTEEPASLVKKLADMKASDVASNIDAPAIIIGSDTVVADDNTILGKPKNDEDAFNMLSHLQGNTHYVYTGVSIIIKESNGEVIKNCFDVATKVKITNMTKEQILNYISTGEPRDKAGAYAIQGLFAPFVENIEGDYYNIVGFPISRIYHYLYSEGIDLYQLRRL